MFVVALVARLVAWGAVESVIDRDPGRAYLIAGDAEGYWDLGADLAFGREYAVYTPPRRVLRTPGLPITIATSISLFGESRAACRGFLAVLAALGPVMIYGLGWRCFGRSAGVVAGLLAACSPLAVGLSPVILSDGLFSMLLALQLSIAGPLIGLGPIDDPNRPTVVRAGLLGLAAGAAVLVRPAWLPAVPIVAVVLFAFSPKTSVEAASRSVVSRRRLVLPMVFAIAFAVTMAPWVIRNRMVTGHFVPTSLWLGPTLFDSFGPDADGGSNMAFFDAEANQRVGMSEYEIDQWYRSRSVEAVTADPGRAVQLAFKKQMRFWSLWPRADEVPSSLVRIAVFGWSLMVFGLAVKGMLRGPDVRVLLLTLGPLIYFAMLHLVFVGSMRYRMPAELPVCVLAAYALPGGRHGGASSSESDGSETV